MNKLTRWFCRQTAGSATVAKTTIWLVLVGLGLAFMVVRFAVNPPSPVPIMYVLATESAPQETVYVKFKTAYAKLLSSQDQHTACQTAAVTRLTVAKTGTSAKLPLDTSPAAPGQPTHPPVVLIAPTGNTAAWAIQHTTLPVVYATYTDPSITAALQATPNAGARVTGVSLDDHLHSHRIALLKSAFPELRQVGMLVDTGWLQTYDTTAVLRSLEGLGVTVRLWLADTEADVQRVFQAAATERTQAWYIPPTYVAYVAERSIIDHLRQQRLPAIHATTAEVEHGALMAYAQDTTFAYDALADLAYRVCSGEAPGSIPVERPRRFVFSIKSHYDLGGRHIAAPVVAQADQVLP